MSAHLSVGERWRVVSMKLDQNMSVPYIASVISCSTQTVHNILDLFRETNDVIERRGRGGGNSLTTDERNVLRQLFYKYPHETSAQINYRFYRRTGVTISSRTIRNYRRLFDFHPVHARTQPFINNEHAQQRLFFSQRHIDHDWSRVIFSDEKAFEVDVSGIVYWIPYNRPRPTSFTSQIQFRIAVFGAVWYNSKSDLVLIRGRTNTTTFVEYLQTALHSHLRYIKNYSFIHDRPTWAHTSSAHVKHRRCGINNHLDKEFQSLQNYLALVQQSSFPRSNNWNIRRERKAKKMQVFLQVNLTHFHWHEILFQIRVFV